jgi:PIN domain nuclease of toxin-antitoxin system
MIYLLDTHLLLWAGEYPERLSPTAFNVLQDSGNQLLFSTVSVWEVAIKFSQARPNFQIPPAAFRQDLFDAGYQEIPILSEHAIGVAELPLIHKDPFDRLLIAQATAEGITLLTSDETIARYPGPIRLV